MKSHYLMQTHRAPTPTGVQPPEVVPAREPFQGLATELPRRVVLAGSDAGTLGMLGAVLRRSEFEVAEVGSGYRLLEALADMMLGGLASRIDLLVSEAGLAGCSGTDLVEGLRGTGWEVPVMLLCSGAEPGDCEAAGRVASAGMLRLPCEMGAFLERVRGCLGERPDAAGLGRVQSMSARLCRLGFSPETSLSMAQRRLAYWTRYARSGPPSREGPPSVPPARDRGLPA